MLELLASGSTTKDIEARLAICESTIKFHLMNAMRKLGARTRTEAVARALCSGEIRQPQTLATAPFGAAGNEGHP